MGREAVVHARVGAAAGEVKALLESHELILRGAIKRRYARAAIVDPAVHGEALQFTADGDVVVLDLGAKQAEAWRKALATPPPSLRAKLGLGDGAKALLVGLCNDADLAAALKNATTRDRGKAAMAIAVVTNAADLAAAQAAADGLPLWAVYRKGKGVAFGDTAVRAALRAAGWRDTKTCAVSGALTATRYHRG